MAPPGIGQIARGNPLTPAIRLDPVPTGRGLA